MIRYVDDLVGVGVHLVEWPGIFCGREFFGGELELHCEVRLEQHVLWFAQLTIIYICI